MNTDILVVDAQPILTRQAIIKFNGSETTNLMTFGLIPETWVSRDMADHPADDQIFYWLNPYEWIRFGVGFDESGEWIVVS